MNVVSKDVKWPVGDLGLNCRVANLLGCVIAIQDGKARVSKDGQSGSLPNFVGDLNECRGMEGTILDKQWTLYLSCLMEACGDGTFNIDHNMRTICEASPRSRVSAFIELHRTEDGE